MPAEVLQSSQGQLTTGQIGGTNLARKCYQRGSLVLKGKHEKFWYGRFVDRLIRPDGSTLRIHRSTKLASFKQCPTKRLAQRELDKVMAEVNSPVVRPRSTITFGEFAEKWKQTVLPNHKPSSQSSEKAHLKTLVDFFGSFTFDSITTERIQMFASGLGVAPKTTRNYIATMRTLWKTAKAWGYVTHNPFDGLVLPRLGEQSAPFYDVSQARRIIESADEPYRTMFWIVAETGIRGGEVCGLKVEDIDLNDQTITIRRSAWRGRLQSPKTSNAVRHFPISTELAEHIRRYLGTMWRGNPDRLLFSTYREGKPLDNYTVVRTVLHPLTDRLGLPRAGLHALRHGNVTQLGRMGTSPAICRERLGHAQFSTTMGYMHAVTEDHRRVADQLGKLLAPTCPTTSKGVVVQ